jgi:hypothetical protein
MTRWTVLRLPWRATAPERRRELCETCIELFRISGNYLVTVGAMRDEITANQMSLVTRRTLTRLPRLAPAPEQRSELCNTRI